MRREFRHAFVERNRPAIRNETVTVAFRTLIEVAEAAEIAVGTRLDQENIHFVIGNADSILLATGIPQGNRNSATQGAEPFLRIEPQSKIDILAFVPDLDPFTPEFRKARDFLPQRLGDGAYDRHLRYLGKPRPRLADNVGCQAETALPLQHPAILLLDRVGPHVTPAIS